MPKKEIIAIIPARGQSKRLPRKNLRLLMGRPLISYTIEAAKRVDKISRIIVTTEDDEIAKFSEELKTEIIKRPVELAKDDSPTIDAIIHVLDTLKEMENYEPSTVILLQPTSPLRESWNIEEALNLYDSIDCEALISVSEVSKSPQLFFEIKDGYLVPLLGWNHLKMRHQDLPKIYLVNGAIYIAESDTFREKRTFYCEKIISYLMSPEMSIDIDTDLDFNIAETLLKLKYKKKDRKANNCLK